MEKTIPKEAIYPTLKLLKITFGVVPMVAGIDKFTNVLTDWEQYINPLLIETLPISVTALMMIIGIIEIIAGIFVFINSEIGGYIVAAWLTAIALSLLGSFSNVDVAVRDLVMAIAAFSMARLSKTVK